MAKIFCQNCGHQFDDSLSFCSNCGHQVKKAEEAPKRFCSSCGATLKEEQEFCGQCGHKNNVAPAVEEQVVVEPVVEEQVVVKEEKQFCPNCGAVVEEGKKFCPDCGKLVKGEQEKFFCQNCGTEMRPDQTFCSSCGSVRGQKAQPSQQASGNYHVIKTGNEERTTSNLTELLRKIFSFTSLGLFFVAMICVLFIPTKYDISIFSYIIDSFEMFELLAASEGLGGTFTIINIVVFYLMTLVLLLMNLSFVTGLFGINKVKRDKFWKYVISLVSNIFMILWYSASVKSLIGDTLPVTIYLVISILIYLMYIALYIFKLIKGEYGTWSFKSKRTGKILVARIIHVVAILVIFIAYSFVAGSDFRNGNFGLKFFPGLASSKYVSMFSIFSSLIEQNPAFFMIDFFSFIGQIFKLMIEGTLVAGFIIGVYRLVVADENDEVLAKGFYGLIARQLIPGFAIITVFAFEVVTIDASRDILDVLYELMIDSYIYIIFPNLAVLVVTIAFSITHIIIHNKWLRENNYK